MGSPNEEVDRSDFEGPQHEVTLSRFFMAQYPVTQAQWRVVAAMEQVNRELDSEPSNFKGDLNPVEKVSWYDAVEFCDRITNLTNRQYRLPTEAEWEYACRADTTTPFHFGETITTDLANYDGIGDESIGLSGSYGGGPKGEYRQQTTPVDHFGGGNAFGLSDLHGNVWEWCQDHWHDYDGGPTDGSAWISENDSAYRVRRGGSWDFNPRYCRSAYRYYDNPKFRDNSIGFRVVCSAPRSLP